MVVCSYFDMLKDQRVPHSLELACDPECSRINTQIYRSYPAYTNFTYFQALDPLIICVALVCPSNWICRWDTI